MTEKLERAVRRALPRGFLKRMPRRVKVIAVSDKEARRLNRKYRKKDYPASVLSFRYGGEYGEIIICPALIRREAKATGRSYAYQMTWMVVHGIVHLAGVHHERSGKLAGKIEKLEQSILDKLFS